MTVEGQQRSLGLSFDQMQPYSNAPQFGGPWTSAASNPTQLFSASSLAPSNASLDAMAKQQTASRLGASSMPYTDIPVSAPSLSAGGMAVSYGSSPLMSLPQDLLNATPRLSNESSPSVSSSSSSSSYHAPEAGYSAASSTATSSASQPPTYVTSTSAPYDATTFAQARTGYAMQAPADSSSFGSSLAGDRRMSQPAISPSSFSAAMDRSRQRPISLADFGRGVTAVKVSQGGYRDVLEPSRMSMAADLGLGEDVTPRNIYGAPPRDNTDSYGFPSAHSSSSSISSPNAYQSYYSSMDSLSEYSSTNESVESFPSRTLPRPQSLLSGSAPAGPQSMMSQFNSKVSSSAQKKHRCKICDKRFTRPSSLQTHMYSHTGEKRTS